MCGGSRKSENEGITSSVFSSPCESIDRSIGLTEAEQPLIAAAYSEQLHRPRFCHGQLERGCFLYTVCKVDEV